MAPVCCFLKLLDPYVIRIKLDHLAMTGSSLCLGVTGWEVSNQRNLCSLANGTKGRKNGGLKDGQT